LANDIFFAAPASSFQNVRVVGCRRELFGEFYCSSTLSIKRSFSTHQLTLSLSALAWYTKYAESGYASESAHGHLRWTPKFVNVGN